MMVLEGINCFLHKKAVLSGKYQNMKMGRLLQSGFTPTRRRKMQLKNYNNIGVLLPVLIGELLPSMSGERSEHDDERIGMRYECTKQKRGNEFTKVKRGGMNSKVVMAGVD